MYDVIVVGAGCAGSSTAMLLARKGRRVLVLDRSGPSGLPDPVDDLGPEGTAMLARWGLLDRLRAAVTESRIVHVGATSLALANRPFLGTRHSATVGRGRLVEELRTAAVEAGAEVRPGFTVTDIVWTDGRTAGVVGRPGDDRCVFERGRMVVGADGHRSVVAEAARARLYGHQPSTNCCYSAIWRCVNGDLPETFFLDGAAVNVLPSPDASAQVTVWLPVGEWTGFKRRPEANYLTQIERCPALAQRLKGARRETRLAGTADLSTTFRQAFGAGWGLVGDAGHRTDPLTGRGIAEGFIQAELLAEAIDLGLSGRGRLDRELARFASVRDERAMAIHRITTEIASYRWAPCDIPGLFGALEVARAAGISGLAA